jgi:thymidylate synthase (FAD)
MSLMNNDSARTDKYFSFGSAISVGKGFVRLDNCMADDYSVVNSARVSFARNTEDEVEMTDADAGLINFLMRERHGTPFEHNAFRFHIKCPVFVAREWFRHRIGSYNEFSARYSEVPNEMFVPELAEVREQAGKPGAYKFIQTSMETALRANEIITKANSNAYEAYAEMLALGVAKEVARTVLPMGMFTQFYWTVNARSLMNFLSLRTDENAQLDIRKFAEAVEILFSKEMPVTYSSWIANGKVAP